MIILTAFAGSCILLGGFAATLERIRPRWMEQELRHSVIAFGGGVLISAVVLVLIPEGTRLVPSATGASMIVIAGGCVFFVVERSLGIRRRETPQLTAMLLDYLPESLALGGLFALGSAQAPLLALLIGLQNFPEGFNAWRELNSLPGFNSVKTLKIMALLIALGPLIGAIGWFYAAQHPLFLGGVMLFASGGILYLLFQDIAPQSHLDRHWGPAVGAVLGFGISMLAQMLVSGA